MRSLIQILPLAALMLVSAAPGRAADPASGGKLFRQRCTMCHTVAPGAPGTLGPNLNGFFGRAAASSNFAYSKALKDSKVVWTKATLDQFLTAPGKMVPGTRMVFNIADAAQRADVVAYLATLKK